MLALGLALLCISPPVGAAPSQEGVSDAEEVYDIPEVLVPYTPQEVFRIGGSAHLVAKEQMEAEGYDNPTSALQSVPGVYVRHEDGYGLRPNIGLRGTTPERSKKVTLMEDGILFAPAPYSSPSAYYFPMMARMTGVEVFKGPAAILYGPNTIGGAINFITRPIPTRRAGGIDLAYGVHNHLKAHTWAGTSSPWGGLLVEAAHLQTDGFKALDGGGETGFNRQEVILKGRLNTAPDGDLYHRLDLKLGYSHERSNETYLGLSDGDFQDAPDRRYASSGEDHMDLGRIQLSLSHSLALGDTLELKTTVYRHDMKRSWFKLGSFRSGPSLSGILAEPNTDESRSYFEVLTGALDTPDEDHALLVADNARGLVAHGLQSLARVRFGGSTDVRHEISLGARIHQDSMDKEKIVESFQMVDGRTVRDGEPAETTTSKLGSSFAVAGHLAYGLGLYGLTVTPGVRMEAIWTRMENRTSGSVSEDSEVVPLVGLGVHYALTDHLGLLAGVHQGFSPVSPGQDEEIQAERSVNYEAGVRFSEPATGTLAEVVGFFNDYSNLTGECTLSSGCGDDVIDDQFNGGAVNVYGAEVALTRRFLAGAGLRVPVRLMYTFTRSEFLNSFRSDNSQWGNVEQGDELPYLPTHQASMGAGLEGARWGVSMVGTFLDSTREVAGQGVASEGEATDRALMLDAMAHWDLDHRARFYVRAENVLNQRPIVSRRPYGARPGKPFMAMAGLRATF